MKKAAAHDLCATAPVTSQEQSGLNVVKASVFRRWLVTAPYRGEQTTRLTGGHDCKYLSKCYIIAVDSIM